MANLTTEGLIDSRQGTHGEFMENSRATWEIMRALQDERNWSILPDHMKHALYMIAHKAARIVAGNPEEPDHWDDIAGYATLVAQRIHQPVKPIDKFEDVYHALSIAWNCPREEAKRRVMAINYKINPEKLSPAQQEMARDFEARQREQQKPVDEKELDKAVQSALVAENGAKPVSPAALAV